MEQAYIAADNIEYHYQNRIPLWLLKNQTSCSVFIAILNMLGFYVQISCGNYIIYQKMNKYIKK